MKNLKVKTCKNSSFLCLCYILRAIRAGRCRERRYADHIFIQIYFRMHHFVVKFPKFSSTPNHKILRTFLIVSWNCCGSESVSGRVRRPRLVRSGSSNSSVLARCCVDLRPVNDHDHGRVTTVKPTSTAAIFHRTIGPGWRRGVVVSGVRRMNEVNPRRARLVPGWVTIRLRVGVTSQLGQLSLAFLRGRLIEY